LCNLDCILLKNKLELFKNKCNVIYNKDVALDENIVLLILSMKYTNDQELNDLATSFGKLSLRKEYYFEVKKKRLDKWFYTEKKHEINGSRDEFKVMFRKAVKEIFMEMKGDEKENINLRDFIKEFGLWGTAGSIYGEDIPKEVKKYIKKNKWGIVASHDLDNMADKVEQKIANKSSAYYQTMVKDESTNSRFVVVADVFTYWVESHLSYFFEHKLAACKQLYNYWSNEKRTKFWERRRLLLIVRKLLCYDLDYSGWDENVNFDMINIIFEELRPYIPEEYHYELDWLIFLITHTFVDGQITKNGLASGRRWTTFINSVCNAAIQKIASWLSGVEIIEDCELGDDMDCLVNSEEDALKHMKVLDSMSFSINKLKSKIGKVGEFLKTNYCKEGIFQSPFRLLRSLLFSTEDEQFNISSMELVNSRLDSWMKLCGRLWGYNKINKICYDKYNISDTILYDFIHLFGHKVNGKDVFNWLISPSTVGGGGITFMDPRKSRVFQLNSKKWATLSIIDKERQQFDKSIIKYIERKLNANLKDKKYTMKVLNNFRNIVEKVKFNRKLVSITKFNKPSVNKDIIRMLAMNGEYLVTDMFDVRNSNLYSFHPKLPDASTGYYSISLLNLNNITIDDIRSDFRNNDFITLNNGQRIGSKSLILEQSITQFLFRTRGKSNTICDLILKNKILNTPRELISLGGEVSSSIYWIVLQSFTNHFFNNVDRLDKLLRLYASMNYLLTSCETYLYNKNITNILTQQKNNTVRECYYL